MKKLIAAIISVALAASCIPKAETEAALARLEARLADAPDSVLTALSEMERPAFLPRSIKAEYALLYSEALDKNGILMRSDSIIAPAVRYFDFHGTPDQKLKTFYYRGLISENGGLPEDAMEWLKKAETNLTPTSPPSLAGRLYSHKSTLYYNAYDYEDALLNNKLAAGWFEKGGDYLCLSYAFIGTANLYICLGKTDQAINYLNKVKEYWTEADERCQISYYVNCINVAIKNNNIEQVKSILSQSLSEKYNYRNHPGLYLKIGEAFLFCHDIDSCASILSEYDRIFTEKDINYYVLLSNYLEEIGQYHYSLQALQDYVQLAGSEVSTIICSDLKYVEERYLTDILSLKNRRRGFVLINIIIILLLVSVIVFKSLKKQLSTTVNKYKDIEKEWKALVAIQQESTILSPQAMIPINKRLALLDKVILGHLSGNPALAKSANAQISFLLEDKENFVAETAKVFHACHPHFTSYLSKSNLSEQEIGYCCLYIMGMYNKDSRPYFSKYASENLNNCIRAKLGLTHNGQKLKNHLKEKYAALEGETSSIE